MTSTMVAEGRHVPSLLWYWYWVVLFVLLESNSTFKGLPKPLIFASHQDQFKFVQPRLTNGQTPGRFHKGENPFVEEAYQRLALDYLLKKAWIQDDDLLIMSDVYEIPSRHTINLLRWCDEIPPTSSSLPKELLVSLEFLLDNNSWRTSVHRYQSGKTTYAHYRQSHRTCMCTNFIASTDCAMEKLEGVSISQSPTQELIFTLEIATKMKSFHLD